jgi:hypothetical protein
MSESTREKLNGNEAYRGKELDKGRLVTTDLDTRRATPFQNSQTSRREHESRRTSSSKLFGSRINTSEPCTPAKDKVNRPLGAESEREGN